MTSKGKRIGIFFNDPGFDDYPFSDDQFRRAYHEFAQALEQRGAFVWIVRSQRTYASGNSFTRGWKFDGGTFVEDRGPVEVDVIFNKGDLIADETANVVNRQELEDFCTDKWKTYQAFPELFPRTLLAQNEAEFKEALKQFSSMVTVKPVDGWRGIDVHIGSAETIAQKPMEFPCLVQDFIDTSGGIPDITTGLHDLRMIVVNGKMIYAYIRVPPPNSYISNYAQGGKWFEVPADKLPAGALEVFRTIDARMSGFPLRIYSVDVGLHKGTEWKIFELNSKPAVDPRESSPGAGPFMDAVADILLQA